MYAYVSFFRSALLGLAFMIIPFLPASNVFFRVGFVVAERILYLPSIGFVILLVTGSARIAASSEAMRKVVTLKCIVKSFCR